MTGVFDGMATTINAVFGGVVVVHPGGGPGVEIVAILRDEQIEVPGDEGEAVVTVMPTLKAIAGDVAGLGEGDSVSSAAGAFSVLYRLPAESPATDRFEIFVLKREAA